MENQKIQLIKRQESFKLTVTKELEEKIRFLCRQLPHNEWSGTLFYTIEGSFKDANIHVLCKDFFLQDVGESTYTEFKNDVELASYMANHELWDCYTGIMHSHNAMPAFFSGTDLETLRVEGRDNNHLVSLIVNNAGTYTAAITRKVKTVSKGESVIEYNTFNNEKVDGEVSPFEFSNEYVEYYMFDVTVEKVPEYQKSELELRLEEVRNSSKSYINYSKHPLSVSKNNTYTDSISKVNDIYTPKTDYSYTYRNNKEKQEGYLFSDKEMQEMKADTDKEYAALDPTIQYGSDHINPLIIENTVTQLITGDIFSIFKQNVDKNKWVSNMETLYAKRFPNDLNDENFRYWVDSVTEFLENEVSDFELEERKDSEYVSAIWAYDTIVRLEEFPTNKYLKIIIESMERWLI